MGLGLGITLLVLGLVGCQSIEDKIGEEIGEGIVGAATGSDVEVTDDGVTIETEDGERRPCCTVRDSHDCPPSWTAPTWARRADLPPELVLAVIEVISYFVRPVSHSIRLAGNLMAGHAVMKVFAGFASMAVISPVAVGAVTAIYGLELLVAVVQAYVFTILTCVYLKDAVGGAHH